MYRDFYGYNNKPFSLLINPDYFYLSGTHREILDTLKKSIETHEFLCVLTGGVGVGKSALIRYFLDNMENNYTPGLVNTTELTADNFIPRLLEAYNQPSSGSIEELTKAFSQFISTEQAKNNHPVLIIDDCHKLPADILEIVHVIIQEFSIIGKAITTILVGEPELRDKLSRKDLEHLSNQINTSSELKPLSRDETVAYIHYQNKVAGADAGLFDDDTCKEIYENTRGIPRSINLLCDSALVYGFVGERNAIKGNIVGQVINDKKEGKLLPNLVRAEEIAKERSQREIENKKMEAELIKKDLEAGLDIENPELAQQTTEKEDQPERINIESLTEVLAEEPTIVTNITQTRLDEEQPVSKKKGGVLKLVMSLVFVISAVTSGYVFYPEYSRFISPLIAMLNVDEIRWGQKDEHTTALKTVQEEKERKAAELAASRAEEQAAQKEKRKRAEEERKKVAVKLQQEREKDDRKKRALLEVEKQKNLAERTRKDKEEEAINKYREQELVLEQKNQAIIERAALEAKQKENANKERINKILQLDAEEPFE